MIIVTGAAGFIGSQLILALNQQGRSDIIAVDDLTDGRKYANLAVCRIADYWDYRDFLQEVEQRAEWLNDVEVIFHQGACSCTTEQDGRYMMKTNFDYAKALLSFSLAREVPFIYASSAAVYGKDTQFDDTALNQFPLNVYGYSKWLFDQYVLRCLPSARSQVAGLRYFNVYGPHEQHKGGMASVAFHLMNQLRETGKMRLFAGSHGYADGEQLRDFVYVDDVVKVNLWLWQQSSVSGIYNCGTGQARPFNAIARTLAELSGGGEIEYIPFPEKLVGAYQAYTQANLQQLRQAGYQERFLTVEEGVAAYYAACSSPVHSTC